MLEKSTRNRITCDSIKQEEFKRMDINIRKNQEFEGFCQSERKGSGNKSDGQLYYDSCSTQVSEGNGKQKECRHVG